MERLDHFVIHIDNHPEIITSLKATLPGLGYPFKPEWSKGTRGFKAANIWVGQQYLEIIRILKPDGGGWPPYWVEKHRKGSRGIYCLFLATERLDKLYSDLLDNGLRVFGPKRTVFKFLFFKESLPWRYILLPEIPGTDMQIGFIQYDSGAEDKFRPHMVPNAKENGIKGISQARVDLPLWNESLDFLSKVFPGLYVEDSKASLELPGGKIIFAAHENFGIRLQADCSNLEIAGTHFSIENVCVETVFNVYDA